MTHSDSPPRLRVSRPVAADHELAGRDDEVLRLRGVLLGFASSRRDDHTHAPDAAPTPGQRCSACRWFECRILAAEAELLAGGASEPARARYLVLTYGRSEVPGEFDKRRAAWTDSPFEVIELLTQRDRGAPFLPSASARALAQAAAWDEDLADAYVNRAVA